MTPWAGGAMLDSTTLSSYLAWHPTPGHEGKGSFFEMFSDPIFVC